MAGCSFDLLRQMCPKRCLGCSFTHGVWGDLCEDESAVQGTGEGGGGAVGGQDALLDQETVHHGGHLLDSNLFGCRGCSRRPFGRGVSTGGVGIGPHATVSVRREALVRPNTGPVHREGLATTRWGVGFGIRRAGLGGHHGSRHGAVERVHLHKGSPSVGKGAPCVGGKGRLVALALQADGAGEQAGHEELSLAGVDEPGAQGGVPVLQQSIDVVHGDGQQFGYAFWGRIQDNTLDALREGLGAVPLLLLLFERVSVTLFEHHGFVG